MTLTVTDWDLYRRSRRDIARHNQKIQGAIRSNLPKIVSQEDIITSDGKKIIKVPVRGLELPHFRFDSSNPHVGQGDEKTRDGSPQTKPGTIIAREPIDGSGKKAGEDPGEDVYEVEISIDELVDILFEELGLPNLADKGKSQLKAVVSECDTIRKTGPQGSLDRRRTLIEAYKRNARDGKSSWDIDILQDPRYKAFNDVTKPFYNAVVFAMRDTSGSMGDDESYICRTFYTWMIRFLQKCYSTVEIVFITCHVEAKEVDEDLFFKAAGDGGTKMSSAYKLCRQIIEDRYDPDSWNIYPFLFSDGDNWGDVDNMQCVDLVKDLLAISNLVGYGEISEKWNDLGSTYVAAFDKQPKFVAVQVPSSDTVWQALKSFLGTRHKEFV